MTGTFLLGLLVLLLEERDAGLQSDTKASPVASVREFSIGDLVICCELGIKLHGLFPGIGVSEPEKGCMDECLNILHFLCLSF